jgi:aryl-alcohol dehydrogenase-like predicted oxidoreductase
MDYTTLGKTGLKVSRLCLGTMSFGSSAWRPWVLDAAQGGAVIRHALDRGINFFDTADMYSDGASEQVLGATLNGATGRDQVVIATKVFYPVAGGADAGGLSRPHIMRAIDDSLRRLQTDYVDLYQIHRYDPHTPIEETLEALHDVVKGGKARHIGASSMYAWQFARMIYTQRARGWTEFVTMQNHYNLVYREEEREMNPFCLEEGVAMIPWSPLARGFLAGNRKRGQRDATLREQHDGYGHGLYYAETDYDVVDRVVEVAARKGVLPIQVALAWILSRPGVAAPIISVTKQSQIDDLVAAVGMTITREEDAELSAPYRPHPILGHE